MNSNNSQSVVGATDSKYYIKLANNCPFCVYYFLKYTLNNHQVEITGPTIFLYSLSTIPIPDGATNISVSLYHGIRPDYSVFIAVKRYAVAGKYCLSLSGSLSNPSLTEANCDTLVAPTPPTGGPPITLPPQHHCPLGNSPIFIPYNCSVMLPY